MPKIDTYNFWQISRSLRWIPTWHEMSTPLHRAWQLLAKVRLLSPHTGEGAASSSSVSGHAQARLVPVVAVAPSSVEASCRPPDPGHMVRCVMCDSTNCVTRLCDKWLIINV